jgi:hypothetical protein
VGAAAHPRGRWSGGPADLAEFWIEPKDIASRDLFLGPGGAKLVPRPDVVYRYKKSDTTGHSGGYSVKDPDGRTWRVKLGDEVPCEIAVSRILWATGYHQPVLYYVPHWRMSDGPTASPPPGRFRLESDHKTTAEWSWRDNPFVGSPALKGMLVIHMLVNNWDLGPDQNRIYEYDDPRDGGPARRFVVQDVGGSLGRTRWPIGGRNDLAGFETQDLVKSVKHGRVEFDFHSRHGALFRQLTPDDVAWGCSLVARLSERQLDDAFRAGGYSEEERRRFVRKIEEKIQQGLVLAPRAEGAR